MRIYLNWVDSYPYLEVLLFALVTLLTNWDLSLMPSTTTNLRSPSPALPGAWPHTPFRSRSVTCPTPTSATDSMPLDIEHAPRKITRSSLSPTHPVSLASDETMTPSATIATMPSEDSQLTKFTQTFSENSMSALTNASFDTSTSTLEERAHSADVHHHKAAPSSSETRIHQLPSPETSPDSHIAHTRRVKSTHSQQQQVVIENEPIGDTSIISQSSNITPPRSSASSSSLSPMMFVSPTASNRTPPAIRRIRATANQSYSFSSDEEGEYDDSGLLRLGSPSLSVSLSSSPRSSLFSSPSRARRQGISVSNVSPISEDYDSSTEGLQVHSQLLLTSLSLPGSVNLDDSISNVSPFPSRAANENTQPVPDWTLSLTGTSEPDFSPRTTSSPTSAVEYSISPSSSLRARLENPLATHVVNFPSPTISMSPAVTSSPLPVENVHALETEAADYATAVMMSSWGSAGLEIGPIGLELSRMADVPARCEPEDSPVGAPVHEQRTIISSNASQQNRGVLSRFKQFGVRMKRILKGKSKERLEIEVSSSRKTTKSHVKTFPTSYAANNPSSTLGEQSAVVQATPPTLELELGSFNLEEHTPIPYPISSSGHPTRLRKPRPSITTDTYSSSTRDNVPLISVGHNNSFTRSPLPIASGTDCVNATIPPVQDPASPPTHSEEIQQQIEAHARPKTLDEIKNRHRLSLSAISNHLARPSSPSGISSGPSTQIVIRQRRPRPASALILPSMTNPPSPQTRRQTPTPYRVSISQPIGPVYHYSGMYPLPPGLETHTPRTRTVRLAVPEAPPSASSSHSHSYSRGSATGSRSFNGLQSGGMTMNRNSSQVPRRGVPDMDQENDRSERNRNQNRFSITSSLSTLSNFAAGLVDHGSWARFDTKRERSP
ncbi:hypothetical protein DFH05DRAFT_65373 [Lentinula detonsa]|uniref:Uncharacterized protein n=1 Tax=Lentinula detonsa TaxID=2804962 RepID=A0A9W8U2X6_9AGAR|nr:hypothetical protein DFH05DRAFT_65373 [Lentinula detonsa]